ncbi:(d)CMP kinase [Ureaplasma zalophigenitalium]|uniref:Cytidylate kinase n=1 Tax=Ureaplasma zalophigenitalium TaxID=907723 RepID=A0ABT3BPX8_9BACT|nr:(d)CMP kinase [Ureaplasma zalophigenitalium]MCV3754296.1 (d)CMP kinase [Ureaplasma zalophigenitalium]
MSTIKIAIDGPSGSGKSSAAKLLAAKLNFVYINTGNMYRTYAYVLNEHNLLSTIKPTMSDAEQKKLSDFLDDQKIVFNGDDVYYNDKNISDIVRKNEVANLASQVAQNVCIRNYATNKQRWLAGQNHTVMDGRDIGTVVLTNADLKIFLNTKIETRARRRLEQNKGIDNQDYETIYEEIKQRDELDMTRALAPLKKADDALEIYNDGMNVDQCVDYLLTIVFQHLPNLK